MKECGAVDRAASRLLTTNFDLSLEYVKILGKECFLTNGA